jgi:dUTP pyrophosphatase
MLVKRLPNCKGMPTYETPGAVGMDLRAAIDVEHTIEPGQRAMIPCGIAIVAPPGFEAQVRARSGLALKHGLSVVNGVGTIDQDYRGEVCALIINHGTEPYDIKPGEKIAQLVISPVEIVALLEVDELPETQRGEMGFGSTGRGVEVKCDTPLVCTTKNPCNACLKNG